MADTEVTTYENCMDCPFKDVILDADPDDWFCDDDQAIVCTKVPNPNQKTDSEYLHENSPYKTVMPAIRPYHLREEGASPSWCPLKAAAEKAEPVSA